uniref:Uncharacterized protein n=1 Tax=viral metagenome TaxID=1070528 RepID=A0A6M3L597_9ZZZZ
MTDPEFNQVLMDISVKLGAMQAVLTTFCEQVKEGREERVIIRERVAKHDVMFADVHGRFRTLIAYMIGSGVLSGGMVIGARQIFGF